MKRRSESTASIERALVALRRSQTRRRLAGRARADGAAPVLTGGAFDVLDVIEGAAARGETVGVADVAKALSVDQPRGSRLVAQAVAAGLVLRTADQTDGRRTLLVCTDAGRNALEQARRTRSAFVEELTADWSPGDVADFARLLTRFTRRL